MFLNKRGSFVLSGLLFTTVCLCVLLGGLVWALREMLALKYQARSALCAKQVTTVVKKYHQSMQDFNQAIFWAYVAKQSKIPKISTAGQMAWEAAKKTQQLYHYKTLLEFSDETSFCGESIRWQTLKMSSTEVRGAFLKRDIDGQATFKDSRWSIIDVDKNKFALQPITRITFKLNQNKKLTWQVVQK